MHFLLQPEAISQAVLILFVVQLEQISISQHRGGRSEEIKWQNNPLDLALQRYFTSCYRRIKKNGLVLQKQRRISRERKPWDFRMLQRVVRNSKEHLKKLFDCTIIIEFFSELYYWTVFVKYYYNFTFNLIFVTRRPSTVFQ